MDFDQFANDYKSIHDDNVKISGESSEYFSKYKASYMALYLSPQFAGKILDFGCGIGRLSNFIKKMMPNAVVHGYDVSPGSLKKVNPALLSEGKFSSDLSRLDRDYDVVVLANVLHHIKPEDRRDKLSQLKQHIADDGRVLLIEHNPFNPITRKVIKLCPFDEDATLLYPNEALHLLLDIPLHIKRKDFIVFFPRFLALLRPLEKYLTWCPLGAQFALWGQK